MKKRGLALALALMLCVSLLPAAALAEANGPTGVGVTLAGVINRTVTPPMLSDGHNFYTQDSDGNWTVPAGKDPTNKIPTGHALLSLEWDHDSNAKEYEFYADAIQTDGSTRSVTGPITSWPGMITTVGNKDQCTLNVQIIGTEAQQRILKVANAFLASKFSHDSSAPSVFPEDVIDQVNKELMPLTGKEDTVPQWNSSDPDYGKEKRDKIYGPLDTAIFRLDEEYNGGAVPAENAKLNAAEEKELLENVAGLADDGTGANKSALLSGREELSVTAEAVDEEYKPIGVSEPVTFDVTVENIGKKFTPEPEEPCPKGGSHNYVWEKDAYEHKQYCTKCGDVKVESARHTPTNIKVEAGHEATCLKEAWVSFDCSVCGYHRDHVTCDSGTVGLFPSLAAYGALGHDFSGPLKYIGGKNCTSETEGSHAVSCTRCGTTDTLNRVPHAWQTHTVSNGTCGDPDDPTIIEGTCECGATLYEVKPREHDYIDWPYDNKEATCTEPGQANTKKCRFCDDKTFDVVEALGHDWVIDEETKADCEHEGHVIAHCSRCDETKDEVTERMSESGQHTWTKNITTQPTCEKEGYYHGEVCSVCGATRNENDVEQIEPLGHLPHTEMKNIGRTKTQPGQYAVVMEIELYESTTTCTRCHQVLKTNFFKVYTTQRPAKYQIVEGKKAELTSLNAGIHVKGNMANDGGAFFRETIRNAMKEKALQETKQFIKEPANSFIITPDGDFLAGLADGAYDVIIINGDEFWPMTVTVEAGEITALEDMVAPDDSPVMTLDEMDAYIIAHGGDPADAKVLYLAGQPGVIPNSATFVKAESSANHKAVTVTKHDGELTLTAIAYGDYHIEGDTNLSAGDYVIDGDTVTFPVDYLDGLDVGQHVIVFHYDGFDDEHNPVSYDLLLCIKVLEREPPTEPVYYGGETTYKITVAETRNGTVTASRTTAPKGAEVTLTVTPDEGYVLGSLKAVDANGSEVPVSGGKFTMPASDVTVTAVFKAADKGRPFTDVHEGDWFYDAVYYCYDYGYFEGVSDTLFDPQGTMTRGMFATVLWRIAGQPAVSGEMPFRDVETGKWYTDAVIWAAGEGLVEGFGDGIFAPHSPITREQMVTILWRWSGKPAGTADLSGYKDADQISGWAKDAVTWAVGAGVIRGNGDGWLNPGGEATRAEVAQTVKNYCENVK